MQYIINSAADGEKKTKTQMYLSHSIDNSVHDCWGTLKTSDYK